MKIVRFQGRDFSQALSRVKAVLGEDAIILETTTRHLEDGGVVVEMVAANDVNDDGLEVSERRADPRGPIDAPRSEIESCVPRFMGFIGLNGSGKTTSLLKTAIHLNKKGQDVVLINADQKKMEAMEALKRAASILGCAFFDAKSPMELLKQVSNISEVKCVLIDFPGVNLFSDQGIEDLKAFFLAIPGLRAVNVVQANLHPFELKEFYRRVVPLDPWATVVTKVDELVDPKRLHEVLADCPPGIVYLSKGQNISSGLEEYYIPYRVSQGQVDERGSSISMESNKELARGVHT